MSETSTYSLILFVHVVAAVALLGSSLLAPLIGNVIRDARSLGELRLWLQFGRRSARGNPPAAFVLLGSGVYLGSHGWWTQTWCIPRTQQ